MKTVTLLLVLFLPVLVEAQDKPVRYFDEHLNLISKEACFEKEPDKYVRVYEMDTAIYYIKILQKRKGKLTQAAFDLIKEDLEAVSDAVIAPDHFIVVEYYPGPDLCNQSGTKDKKLIADDFKNFKLKLHKIAPVSQFNIYGEPEGLERYKNIMTWRPDLNHRLQRTFFKVYHECGSFVVLSPDGRFIASFGEHSYDYICDMVMELKNGG